MRARVGWGISTVQCKTQTQTHTYNSYLHTTDYHTLHSTTSACSTTSQHQSQQQHLHHSRARQQVKQSEQNTKRKKRRENKDMNNITLSHHAGTCVGHCRAQRLDMDHSCINATALWMSSSSSSSSSASSPNTKTSAQAEARPQTKPRTEIYDLLHDTIEYRMDSESPSDSGSATPSACSSSSPSPSLSGLKGGFVSDISMPAEEYFPGAEEWKGRGTGRCVGHCRAQRGDMTVGNWRR